MQRVFTEDRGRYRKGEVKDWPITTWRSFFPGFERFTRPVDEVVKNSVAQPDAQNKSRAAGRRR